MKKKLAAAIDLEENGDNVTVNFEYSWCDVHITLAKTDYLRFCNSLKPDELVNLFDQASAKEVSLPFIQQLNHLGIKYQKISYIDEDYP